jgi:type IV fimbrial biogenesis protein FimT
MATVRGFTLIELLATLAVAAIVMAMALPAMSSMILDNSTSAATNEMLAALNYARTQAMVRRSRTILCRSGDYAASIPQCDSQSQPPAHDGYEDGWIVFEDTDGNKQPGAASDVLRRFAPASRGSLSIRGNSKVRNRIEFAAQGMATAYNGTVVVCDRRGWSDGGHHARLIVIGFSGRIRSIAGDEQGSAPSIGSCSP